MVRVSCASLLALAGCYLQPTVFDSDARVPTLEVTAAPTAPDVPIGCMTFEPSGRRRVAGTWWLGARRVTYDEIERTLASSPLTAPLMARVRRDKRLSLGLFFAGVALTVGSIAGMAAWIHGDEQSREPLVMLAPAFSGYALGFAAVPVAIRGDHEARRAVDTFNDAAAGQNRCPPRADDSP
jgi:hypothetical protein